MNYTGTSGDEIFLGTSADDFAVMLAGNDLALGSAGNDTIQGGTGNDTIQGGIGNDVLLGELGADLLDGGDGDDFLDGGAGDDALAGGNGNDAAMYLSASGPVNVNLGTGVATGADGNDTLSGFEVAYGSPFSDTISGDQGSNYLVGDSGNDTILGQGGNDTLEGGDGNDSLNGGAGLDQLYYANAAGGVHLDLAAGVASGGGGNDTLSGVEDVYGSVFDDDLLGDGGVNKLFGYLGNDTLLGAGGNDYLSGGDAIDSGDDFLGGGDGDDFLAGEDGNDTLSGGAGNDILEASSGNDVAVFSGNFAQYAITLDAVTGDMIVSGPDGIDRLRDVEVLQFADRSMEVELGSDDADDLQAADGGELVRGGGGNDTVRGGAGNDALYGDAGTDTLTGGAGSDLLDGGIGADRMTGGSGSDTYVVDDAGDEAIETDGALTARGRDPGGPLADSIGTSIDKVISSIDYTLGNLLENLQLTEGSAALSGTGNGLANEITGNAANNRIAGLGGDDDIAGGAGIDTAIYSGQRSQYTVSRVGDQFSVNGSAASEGTDTLSGIERLQFADGKLALDLEGNAGSVAKVLATVFGAASTGVPGYVGVGLQLVDGGMSYEALMQLAIELALGDGYSHADVMNLLYFNLAGRLPEASTLALFVNALDTGLYTVTGLAMLAADFEGINAAKIDLAGLIEHGIAYV